MKRIFTIILMLAMLLIGGYSPLHYLAFTFPILWKIPVINIDPLGVGLIDALFIMPALGLVSFTIAIFHRWLRVPISLPLPSLIYSTLSGVVFYLGFTAQNQPAWLQARLHSGGEPFISILYFTALVVTVLVVIQHVRKQETK